MQHAHKVYDGFHNHSKEESLAAAIESIKKHDRYQMTHRKPESHPWDEYRPVASYPY